MRGKMTLLLVFTFAACRGQPREATSPAPLRLALGTEPPTLDPQLADTGVSVFVLRQVVSTLFEYDASGGEAAPSVVTSDAESYQWSPDGRTLRVVLRSDLRWSDGVALEACHYRDGIARALDPKIPSALADLLFDIKGAAEKKAGKESELGLRCDATSRSLELDVITPYANRLLHALAFVVSAPVRSDRIAKLGEAWLVGGQGLAPISSGAYVIDEWKHDVRVRLVARTDESLPADRRAKTAIVEMPIVRDPSTAFSMYESGQLDAIEELPPALIPKLVKRADAIIGPAATTYMVGFGPHPWLRDKRVRQALALTAHQEEAPLLLGGGEAAARGWIPEALLPSDARPRASLFDPVRARKLLKEAGARKGARLELYFNPGERHKLLMERLANNWKTHLGVEVVLTPLEWKVMVARLKSKAPPLYRYAWSAVYPDPLFFLELFTTGGLNNFGGYSNAELDAIVARLNQIPVAKRDAKFWSDVARAQEILVREDPGVIPIYHYVRNALVKPGVKGFEFDIRGLKPLRLVSKAESPGAP